LARQPLLHWLPFFGAGQPPPAKPVTATEPGVPMSHAINAFMKQVKERDPAQPEFHQAVHEVVESIWPLIENNPKYQGRGLLERIIEPERVIQFRVAWVDDHGQVQVNRGYRVQMNSAIGPYK